MARQPYLVNVPLPTQSNDVLSPGDIIGHGIPLRGEPLALVADNPHSALTQPSFRVISELGQGSYAVVYLVQETSAPHRHFAVKCLSKQDLDADALALQMSEAHIHLSLRLHPNIVTLHRTLQSPSFLLLVLEYVPGQDLFYFLEQSRDASPPPTPSATPPTPSLLSSLQPTHLLSHSRLRLVASMFSQMCDAVAACHAQSVFHRDIKPENFIVTQGTVNGEQKVLVKLTDFGLSTLDTDSADMDCGSAPYMSYGVLSFCSL